MAVTRNIRATYSGPGRVVSGLLSGGQREDRALAYLMAGCFVMFIGQWPNLQRVAIETEQDLHMLLGGAMMGWIFIAPLVLYGVAAATRIISLVFGGTGSFYGARLALFWAILAASPLFLLVGLVSGLLGPGLEQRLVGILWFAFFLWFWFAGFIATQRAEAA